jgi:hypothetical protein
MSPHRQICIILSSESSAAFFFAAFAGTIAAAKLFNFSLSADFCLIAVDSDIEPRTKAAARIERVILLYMI